ncbi:MAG TPA: serine/threonine-protein kinase [Kofleriaceae bacterium]|nr:serine/threonine-protein kinase [Kofleriaceae bacterium]
MGVATLDLEVGDRPSSLSINTAIGDYRIDGVIGSGGMATVYRATQTMIGKRVAIKVMHRTKSDTAISRFVKEARAVNLIGHPNIVDVFGFGMMDDGRPYLVMELLEGETLAVRAERAAMSIAEVANVLIEVSHALEAAHEAGIVHRDLKPENVFITKRKQVKLLDFGIAKLFGEGDLGTIGEDTRPGVLIGTPRYISPEQVRGTALDGRVDIYAMGVLAFELLARHTLFTANNPYDMFQKHAKLRPPKPSAFNASLPVEIDSLVGEMLAKEPSDRPTLASVRERLEQVRDATPVPHVAPTQQATDVQPVVASRARQTTDVALPLVATPTDHDPTTTLKRTSAKRWVIAGLCAGALVGAALAVVLRPAREPGTPLVMPVMPVMINAPTSAPVVEDEPSDEAPEQAIVIDPVTHVHTTVKKAPTKKRVKPRAVVTAPKPDDDDAVRSPFEHSP